MKKLFPLIAVLATLCATAAQRPLQLIPQPVRAELREGHFAAPGCKVTAEGFASRPEGLIRVASALAAPHGKQPARKTRNTLLLQLDARAGIPAEGYRLRVAEHEAELTAGDESGIFYGLQTLLQMADADGNIPCAEIEDYPRYGYRGLHLDVCRHFFPVEFVKGYLDRMAAAKLNRFHWHLTDDQGWRIEIKRYPRLTQVGAWRSKSQIGSYEEKPATFEFGRYGGFYTQDEIREVVAYAAERYITVIPEIEMPGHSLAALTAYPWLGCTNGDESYEIAGWICGPGNVLCPGKESTFEFLENVLDEVVALFPSKLIHIGGDECQHTRWEACPDCQARIAAEGLRDETQLQSYLTHRIDSYLTSKGRQLIGWDEIMEGGLSPGAVIMSWRGTQGGIAAAREYHHVVMTPGQYLYFDKRGTDSPDEPVSLNLSLPLEKIYGYDPAEGLSEEEQQYLLGVQANLWTEFVATGKRVEYQLLPRIYALSENRMVARGAQVVGGVLPAAPSGIPCAARRRRGSLSGSATPRHPRRDARRGMFPLHDPPAFPGLPGLLHAQRRHALRLRPRSAGLSGGGRSPRGTTGAQMRRRHPRRTPEHGRHHPPGQPRGVTRRTAGHGYCQKST